MSESEATPNEPNPPNDDEGGFWKQQRSLSYPLVAAVVLPPLVVATGVLLYRDLDRFAHEPLPVPSASQVRPAAPRPPPPSPAASGAPASAASAFQRIYREASWGKNDAGVGTSGSGSTLAATAPYRLYLQAFLKEHKIRSVVDAGCGDWEFSHALDWSGIDYKGYDIVESVIAANKAKYEKPNIHFFTADIVKDELPPADLLIVKHVFQHLPNDAVSQALLQLAKFKHILLVDSVNARTLSGDNRDIAAGEFRAFDPSQPPFHLPGLKELTWWDGRHMQQVVHLVRADDVKAE